MKHVFIINPAAGTGASEKSILPKIIKFVKEHGEDFEIHRTLNKQEIGTYVASRASAGIPIRFYAVGGDGTICDVVNGIAKYPNAELAIIPCGSGNDFAKNFTNKDNFFDLNRQLQGSIEYIDVIQHNDRYSLNMLNIGSDCEIVIRSSELRKEKNLHGAASYAAAALEILPKGHTFDLECTLASGEKIRDNYMLVAIGNGKYCGGGFKSCPNAKLNDGLLDVCLIKLCKGAKLFQMLLKYRNGTHLKDKEADKYCQYLQVSELKLTPYQDVSVSVDGETEEFVDSNIKIIPKAIKFVVPKGSKLIE